jgi:hypothetical protein
MRDWTPLPPPTDELVDYAARDLLHLAQLEPLQRGGVTFRRADLKLVSWFDPGWGIAFDGDPDEITVPLYDWCWFIDDDNNVDPVAARERNLERCRLAIRQAVERCDLEIVLMGKALAEIPERKTERTSLPVIDGRD